MSSGTIALSTVNVELDGNVAEGVLTFATDGRQTVQGTLAADELNLTPYVSTVRLLTGNERDWNRVPLSIDDLNGFDLDLRLSAARIAVARAKLGRTAIAANLRGGKFTVTIGESQAFGGVLKGSLGARRFGSRRRFQVAVAIHRRRSRETAWATCSSSGGSKAAATSSSTLDATGNSVLAMTRALNGTARLNGRQGAMVGLNVEQLLRRLERRPLSGAGDFRTGRTPYEKLTVDFKIAEGAAAVEEMRISKAPRSGSASPARRRSRPASSTCAACAALASAAPTAPPAFELPFVVQGPWDDPMMLPDTQALMQRSPAASPLLNAVKNRNTRDTVRNAIERLTGRDPLGPRAAPRLPSSQRSSCRSASPAGRRRPIRL